VLLPLPPYAPELNPMENAWEFMRGNFFSYRVWDGYDAIIETCCGAWNTARLHERKVGRREAGLGDVVKGQRVAGVLADRHA
jgi:hypothetical protein